MKKFIPLLALALAACTPLQIANGLTPSGGVQVRHDISFGPVFQNKLDIYTPAAAPKPAPIVVFFYGGRWQMGSKDQYAFVADVLARAGNIVVVPEYRHYPQVRFPAFLQDAGHAVAWVQAHAAAIGGDPRRVFVMGHSSGAYLAVMMALDDPYLAQAGGDRTKLAGVIGLAGPYDFLPLTDADVQDIFAPAQDGPASQPISYVDGRNPKLLLLAGGADTTVKPRNTLSLAAKVQAAGGSAEAKIYPGRNHVDLVSAFIPVLQDRTPVLHDVQAFIESH